MVSKLDLVEQFLAYKNSTISYRNYGTGNETLVCLHGFGEEATSFSFLQQVANNSYTVIAINMPLHGNTQWQEGVAFLPQDLHQITLAILDASHISRASKKISLLGYSMGGRLALAYFQQYPDFIKKMILVAPDGLHNNHWYWFATQTFIGNRIFKYTMQQPEWFLGMVKLFGKTGIINKSVVKFVNSYLGDEKMRTALYTRWTTMRKFSPDLAVIKQLIEKNTIHVNMLFGEFDRIILYRRGEKFKKGLEYLICVKTIKAGHQILNAKYAGDIVQLLNG